MARAEGAEKGGGKMTLNERLVATLSPVVVPVAADVCTENVGEYITFHYDTIPLQFADNRPIWERALIQVHYFCPLEQSSLSKRRAIRLRLTEAGFPWPEVVNATGEDGQHYIFETEAMIEAEEAI